MIRRLFIVSLVAASLSGCATNPQQFSDSVNNAVNNVQTASVASVTIGTDIIQAVLALVPAVLDVMHLWRK